MIDRRTKNAEIFRDTEHRYKSDLELIATIQESTQNQVFIAEKSTVNVTTQPKTDKAMIVVSNKRSLEAAEAYAKQGKKVCVLNFACLNNDELWTKFYKPHRKAANPLYNNDCIYTPNVCVFKSDINFPELLSRDRWWRVNILTCAAPNLRERPSNPMNPHAGYKQAKVTPIELESLLTARIRRIFEVAVANENEVLILGAFGCGAFRNPPEIVAKVFYNVMQDFLGYFDTIEYAVYHTECEVANYEAFQKILNV